jgi:hypothetical protein
VRVYPAVTNSSSGYLNARYINQWAKKEAELGVIDHSSLCADYMSSVLARQTTVASRVRIGPGMADLT